MNQSETIIQAKGLNVHYDGSPAVSDVSLDFARNRITAIIGPSGCGKSTLLRCFNRMNELIPSARITGEVLLEGQNIYAPGVDPTDIRYQVGMVFQNPTRSPSPSTTTWPSDPGSTASGATWASWWNDRYTGRRYGMR